MVTLNKNYAGIAWALRSIAMSDQEKQLNTSMQDTPTNASPSLKWAQPAANRPVVEAYKTWPPERGMRYTESVKTQVRLGLNLTAYLQEALRKMNSDGKLHFAVDASANAYEKFLKLSEGQTIQHEQISSARPSFGK